MSGQPEGAKAQDVEEGEKVLIKDSLKYTAYTWECVTKSSDINKEKKVDRWGMDCIDGGRNKGGPANKLECDVETMSYNMNEISTWSAFRMLRGSAWDNKNAWKQLGKALGLATVIAIIVGFATPDPEQVRSNRFAKLSTFLSVFVGLLLSFFMSSSMVRWYNCVNAFLELFDAVRNMQMQCHALGVCRQREQILTRYGVLSSWLLHLQLVAIAKDETEEEAMKDIWDDIMTNHPGLCLPEEMELLSKASEPCQTIWTWVASLVGRMAMDGDIPPMPSPTYGRILGIITAAHGAIRQVRSSVCVQAPFIYIHTLAVLVHFNNVINAVSFGLTWGVSLAKMWHFDSQSKKHEDRMYAKEIQNLTIAFFLSMVGPFLYQALLDVSVCIAQPFNKDNDNAMIPTVRLLKNLERDLCECDYVSRKPPFWGEPHFKPINAANAAAVAAAAAKK